MQVITLTTEHLTLRPIAPVDEPLIDELNQRPEICRYLGSVGQAERTGDLVLVISHDNVRIGVIGIVASEALDGTEVELFVALCQDFEGRGFAFEACTSLISSARAAHKWKRILASVDRSNLRSAELVKRLHFSYLGDRPVGNVALFELVL